MLTKNIYHVFLPLNPSTVHQFYESSGLLPDYFRSLKITESCLSVNPILCSVLISYKRSRDRQCLDYFLFSCCAISTMAPSDTICSFYVEEKKKEKKVLADSGQNLTTHSCKGGWECNDLLLLERQTKDKGSGRGLK